MSDEPIRDSTIACGDMVADRAGTTKPAPDAVRTPTEAMLNAARDWSVAKYGRGIGNDAAIGCWQAMLDAALRERAISSTPAPSPEARAFDDAVVGAAEPVAVWTVRQSSPDEKSPAPADEDYPAEHYWDVFMPDGTWGGCVAVDANDARDTMQKSWAEDHPDATPPVRGDREAIRERIIQRTHALLSPDFVPEIVDSFVNDLFAILSLPVQSGVGERQAPSDLSDGLPHLNRNE